MLRRDVWARERLAVGPVHIEQVIDTEGKEHAKCVRGEVMDCREMRTQLYDQDVNSQTDQ